jgi:hypothetical protein
VPRGDIQTKRAAVGKAADALVQAECRVARAGRALRGAEATSPTQDLAYADGQQRDAEDALSRARVLIALSEVALGAEPTNLEAPAHCQPTHATARALEAAGTAPASAQPAPSANEPSTPTPPPPTATGTRAK